MSAMLPDLGEVRAGLRAAEVLRHLGIEVREPPRVDWYGHQCPREYHRQSPRAFVIDPETGLWQCFAGCLGARGKPLGGDLIALIAAHEDLATSGEGFARVVAIAADLAGVSTTSIPPEERERRRRERAAQEKQARCPRCRSVPLARDVDLERLRVLGEARDSARAGRALARRQRCPEQPGLQPRAHPHQRRDVGRHPVGVTAWRARRSRARSGGAASSRCASHRRKPPLAARSVR